MSDSRFAPTQQTRHSASESASSLRSEERQAPKMERISATYLIETPMPVEKAAAVLADEQSSGTFVDVPGETDELKQRFAARVEKITPLQSVPQRAFPV